MHEWLTIVAPSIAAVVPLMIAIVVWRLNECSKLKWEHRHLKVKGALESVSKVMRLGPICGRGA